MEVWESTKGSAQSSCGNLACSLELSRIACLCVLTTDETLARVISEEDD